MAEKVRKFTLTQEGKINRSFYCDDLNFNGDPDPKNDSQRVKQYKKEIADTAGITVDDLLTLMEDNIPQKIGDHHIRPLLKLRLKDNGNVRFQLFLFDQDKVSEAEMLREKYEKRPGELALFTRYMRQVGDLVWINDGNNTLCSSDLKKKQVYPYGINFFMDLKEKIGIEQERFPVNKENIVAISRYGYIPEPKSWQQISKILHKRINFWADPSNKISVLSKPMEPATLTTLRDFLMPDEQDNIHKLIHYKDNYDRPLGKILIKGDFTEDYAGYRDQGFKEAPEDWKCIMHFDKNNSYQMQIFDSFMNERIAITYDESKTLLPRKFQKAYNL